MRAGILPIRVKLIRMISKVHEEFFVLVGVISTSYEGAAAIALRRVGEPFVFVVAIRRRKDVPDL